MWTSWDVFRRRDHPAPVLMLGTVSKCFYATQRSTAMAHSCTKCELKFELIAEVADHLSTDHGLDVQTPAGADLYGDSRKR